MPNTIMIALTTKHSSKKDAPYVAREAVAIQTARDDHITAGEAVTVGLTYKDISFFGEMGSHNSG